jgi:hypothetical protein
MKGCESCYLFSQRIDIEKCAGCIEKIDGIIIFKNWMSGVKK